MEKINIILLMISMLILGVSIGLLISNNALGAPILIISFILSVIRFSMYGVIFESTSQPSTIEPNNDKE